MYIYLFQSHPKIIELTNLKLPKLLVLLLSSLRIRRHLVDTTKMNDHFVEKRFVQSINLEAKAIERERDERSACDICRFEK